MLTKFCRYPRHYKTDLVPKNNWNRTLSRGVTAILRFLLFENINPVSQLRMMCREGVRKPCNPYLSFWYCVVPNLVLGKISKNLVLEQHFHSTKFETWYWVSSTKFCDLWDPDLQIHHRDSQISLAFKNTAPSPLVFDYLKRKKKSAPAAPIFKRSFL